jgi:uncharacterized membrane protein (UPF0127 family)
MKLAEAKGQLCLQQGGEVVLPRIAVASSFWRRGLGLMGRKAVPAAWGAGLFFANCRSLQGCFMRFELEVWFLDAGGQPVEGPRKLKPWGMVCGPKTAVHCMEIMPGSLQPAPDRAWVWAVGV